MCCSQTVIRATNPTSSEPLDNFLLFVFQNFFFSKNVKQKILFSPYEGDFISAFPDLCVCLRLQHYENIAERESVRCVIQLDRKLRQSLC